MKKVYVITGVGSKNSLGAMICESIHIYDPYSEIIAISAPGVDPDLTFHVESYQCDLSNAFHTKHFFINAISINHPEIYCLINCAGTNKMDWFSDVKQDDLERVMNVNCMSPIFAIQSLLQNLQKTGGTVLNIISMGAHKAFRTSLAYNISKAALKMANAQLARELSQSHGITIFGISPNELAGTGMTIENLPEICRIRGWTEEQAEEYRIKSSGQSADQTDPKRLADFIGYLLHDKNNHKHFNGVDIYYGD